MHPVGAFGTMLPDELVELAERTDDFYPTLAFVDVTVYAEVGCFAFHVLAVADTADGLIEARAPVAATYLYLVPHRVA